MFGTLPPTVISSSTARPGGLAMAAAAFEGKNRVNLHFAKKSGKIT